MHPLLQAQSVATTFRTGISLSDYPASQCPATIADLKRWIETLQVSVSANMSLFGYTAGTMDAARPEDRDKPRIMFDDQGRYIGVALWMPELQGWSVPGQIGQLMTVVRTKDTVAADIAAKPLAGWRLADGTTAGLPNLAQESNEVTFDTFNNSNVDDGNVKIKFPSQWFRGTSPNWDMYTLGYVGT